jgi:hypothetical protein
MFCNKNCLLLQFRGICLSVDAREQAMSASVMFDSSYTHSYVPRYMFVSGCEEAGDVCFCYV